MKPRRRTSLACLVLGLVAFMIGQLSGAHLHLCFDGQEPPTTVHLADGSMHDECQDSEAPHQDRDVEVLDAAFVKKFGDGLPDYLLTFALATVLPSAGELRLPRLPTVAPLPSHSPFRLKPPLRGPPVRYS